MPAATNKADLIAVARKEFAKLDLAIASLDAATAARKADDGWSIQDIIIHRTHWSGLFFTWLDTAKAGHPVQTPAPGHKWNQLKQYNATVIEAAQNRPWAETRRALKVAHQRMIAYLQDADDAALYTPGLYPWMNRWTLGRWAEASSASHYRSATKEIRKRLRALKD